MKKFLAIFLSVLFLMTALAGCNDGAGEATQSTDGTGSSSTSELESASTAESTSADTESSDTVSDKETAETTEGETSDTDAPDEDIDILFIGNSYTYYNDMPKEIFAPICRAAGYSVNVDQITKGSWNLYKFSSASDEMGEQVHAKLSEKKYDYVIIQEQSSTPVKKPGQFYTSVRRMVDLIESNGAETVLYATWGYQEGYSGLEDCGGSTEVMEMKLRAAYTAIAEELDLDVAYVGAAMLDVYKNSQLGVYASDMTHPSEVGSIIAAYTIFSQIFGVDPRTVDYKGILSEGAIAIVHNAVYNATFVDHSVSEEYKTSSEGVEVTSFSNIDPSKTVNLTALPSSEMISVSVRNSTSTDNGWRAVYQDRTKTFSGIRGTKDAIAASVTAGTLTDTQRNDVADIGYGVSVIGIASADKDNAVANLVNGHWGSSFMANMTFDDKKYDISGAESAEGEFTALITLNFGSKHVFDAIGYMSGSLYGFPQIQKVYVSDDGVNWRLVESACYDAVKVEMAGETLVDLGSCKPDPWNNNNANSTTLFGMNGATGQYIRIGVIAGRVTNKSAVSVDLTKTQDINTREIVVFGSKIN